MASLVTTTVAGNVTLTNATPQVILTDTLTDPDKTWALKVNNNSFYITETGVADILTIAAGGATTFSGALYGTTATFSGIVTISAGNAQLILDDTSSGSAFALFSNANCLRMAKSGGSYPADYLELNASGEVGIGVASGTYQLNVGGSANFSGALTGASATFSRAQTTAPFTTPFLKLTPSSTTSTTGLTSITLGTSTLDNYGYSISGWRADTNGNPYLKIMRHFNSAAGVDVMVMDAQGNVGIGTTAPSSPLTIKSSSASAADSAFTIQGNSNTNAIVKIAEKSTDGARFHM